MPFFKFPQKRDREREETKINSQPQKALMKKKLFKKKNKVLFFGVRKSLVCKHISRKLILFFYDQCLRTSNFKTQFQRKLKEELYIL